MSKRVKDGVKHWHLPSHDVRVLFVRRFGGYRERDGSLPRFAVYNCRFFACGIPDLVLPVGVVIGHCTVVVLRAVCAATRIVHFVEADHWNGDRERLEGEVLDALLPGILGA